MKLHKKIAAVMLCAALLFATACGTAPAQEQSATPDSSTPTIRFLLRGTASGMDRVLDALYAQMDDDHRWQLDFTFVDSGDYAQQLARSLTAHDNYDFVFDAPWQSLAMQTEQKNYKNLKNYFSSPEYPALQAAFSEEYLAANTISGGLYAIPFTNTYYDVPGIFYRKDLLQTLGLPFNEITNRAEMEQYWAAVRKKGEMKPISLGSRGFYQYNLPEITLRQNGIWVSQGWSFWDYPSQILLSSDGKQVLDVVFPGDSNEHFAALPEGYQINFLDAYLQQNATDSQWLSPDDLLQENGAQVFLLGQSASYEASLASGTGQVQQQLRTIVPEGEVAFWTYDDAFLPQNRAQGSIPTTYAAWNDLCVPSYSTNTSKLCVFWIGCTAIGAASTCSTMALRAPIGRWWAMRSTPFCSQWGRHSASHPMNWRGIHSTTVLIPPCRTRKRRCWNLPSTKAAMRLPRWRASPLTQRPSPSRLRA